MSIKNLTPHAINIVGEGGSIIVTFKPDGVVARAKQTTVSAGDLVVPTDSGLRALPLTRSVFGEPQDLPDPEEGVWLIVSLATANAARVAGRDTSDLLLTAEPVRDNEGRIIGCRSLGLF